MERGFHFNDVDVMVISESEVNSKLIKKKIERTMGVTAQIISLNNKTLRKGLATDPLYRMMLSKCVALKRFIYKIKPNINYKLLDLHLLKSKTLIDNFDVLGGGEKYYLVRNMVAIAIFLKSKKVDKEIVDKEIKIIFKLKSVNEIKQNRLDKTTFVKKYKQFYKKTFDKIMEGIKCGA